MSQEHFSDVDAEFAELLGENGNEDTNVQDTGVEAPVKVPTQQTDPTKPKEVPPSPKLPAEAAIPDAAATQEHQVVADEKGADSGPGEQALKAPVSGGAAPVSGGVSKKPALAGRKRQLTVAPIAPTSAPAITKHPSVKAVTAPKTAASSPLTEPAHVPERGHADTDSTPAASTATAAASAALPSKRRKSNATAGPAAESGEATAADVETAVDDATNDNDMQEAGEEDEVKSPVKAIDSSAAGSSRVEAADGNEKAKPAAGRKKKGLVLAKAAAPADSAATTATAAASKISKSCKPPVAKRSKLAAEASGSASAAAAPAVKLPKPKNAFMIFSDDKRASIKEANPGINVGEIAKQLGEMWKGMTTEDKQHYTNKAIADKERCAAEIAAMDQDVVAAIRKAEVDKRAAAKGAKKEAAAAAAAVDAEDKPSKTVPKQASTEKKEAKQAEKSEKATEKAAEKAAAAAAKKAEKAAAKAAAKEEANKKKAALKCFYTSSYKSFREKSPSAAPEEISTQIKEAWEALTDEEQKPFFTKAEEEAEALKAVNKPKSKPAASSTSGSKRGRPRKSHAGSDDEGGAASGADDDTAVAADDSDDSDREDVDWEEHPAAAIIAHTTDGASMLVQRKGVGLNEYGCVNARKAKQQLIGGADESEKVPITAAMMEEYDQFKRSFWTAVHKRTAKGAIDMEDLEDGSPLEMCYMLGKLQEENQLCCPKGKASKNKGSKEEDFLITVPGLKLSMAMQRILNVARGEKLQLQQHLGQLLQALKSEKSLSSATQEAVAVATAGLKL